MAISILRSVRPTSKWQDSLIRIRLGQRVVIDSEETWSPDMLDQVVWCGPDGIYKFPGSDQYLVPGANVGCLVARIGNGKAFAVGSRYDFLAKEAGVIFFAMNEDPQRNSQAGKILTQVIVFESESN